jgi:NuA3 HAT complex component NTO1
MSSYILAIEEAQKWERGELLEGFVETDPNAAGVPAEAFDASATVGNKEKAFSGPQCKSCGSLVKEGKFLQTRDWTELCRPCKRAYDNGDFCKVCEALYLPTEKEMVCCDSCNGWIHGKCDPEASKVLQQVAANPEGEVAYLCILCREIFSKQGLERKPGTAGFILQHKGKSSLLDQAKQLFAVDFLNDARRKKSWVRSVKEEAKAVNTAWAQLTADGQQEYIARVAPKPANKRKPSDKDKSAAGNQGNLNPKDAAIVAKPKKVPDGPWQKVHQKKFVPVKARWAKDYCSICDLGHDYEFDQFLTCTSCGITVHQSCYGVQELPALDDVWLCRACEKHEKGKKRPQCCVCPVEGGALKPTTLAGYWCHVACMQWLPEITVVDVDRMEPIDRITKINKQRWEKKCSLCKQDTGAIIQCDSCYTAFHPLCARMAGCEMVTEEDKNGNIFFKAFCPRHSSKLNLGRTGLVSATSEVEIEGEKRLVDPSQYVFHINLPPMDIHCATGCGRCEPLHSSLGWQRENKGSGRGISSTKGFWIPQPLEAPAPPAESSKAKKTPVKSVSRKRNAQPATYSKYWPKTPIPLEPLPEGCPERVRVNCGSVHGFFTVRSQTILYEGQEIAASKFEALGGKGSTKKWKLSLWACDENRTRVMQMNDWLNGFGFTKAYLFSLKMNTSNREKYTEWKNSQEGSDQVEVETVLTRVINEVMLKSSSPSNGNNAVQNDGDDQKVTSLEEPTSSLPPSTPTPVAAGLVSQGQNNHIDRDTDPALDNGNGSEKVVKEVVRKAFENVIHSEKNALVRNQFGTAAVGETVKIFLSEVNTWCEARILRYSEKHGMHKVEHRYGSNEWLSLLFHERITWDNKISEPPKVQSPPSPGLSSQEDKDKDPFLQKKFLSECVGKRVGIWWKDDGCFYYGQIREYDPAREANAGKCWQIMYDDGVEEWLDLKQERVEWNQPPVVGALGKMSSVAVTCNGLKGYFMTMSNQIHVFGVYGVPLETFVEFAGLRGKGSSWKVAIRILKKDNSPGQTIGDWLFEHGLEQKSYSPSKENKMKRRNHHEGHTRRVRVDVKRQRCGKQAFVRGLAYRVKFSRKREEVPDHKSWSGKDWLAKFKTNDSPFPSAAVDGGAATAEGGGPDAKKDNGEENAVLTAVVDAAVDPAVEAVMDAILKMVVESAEQGYDSSAAENTLLSNKPAVESTPACAQIPSGPEGIISSLMHELVWQTERKAEMGLMSSTGLMGQEVHLNEHSADGVRETGRVVGLGESAIKIERKDKNVIEVPFGDDLIWWHTLMNVNRRPKHVKQFFRKKGELISDQAGATGAASSLPPGSNDCYPVALGVYCVGWGVSLLWPDNNMYYYGVVDDYNYLDDKHRILYDDGNYEWLHLIEEEIKWLKRPDLIKKRKDDIPDEVRVASNGIEGIFHVHIRKIAVAKKMLKVMRFVSNTMFASNEHKNKKVQELLQESEEDPKPSKVKSARLREKAKGQLPVDPPSSTSSAAATGEEEDKEIALLVKEMMRLAFSKVLGEEVGGGSATNNTEKDTITEDSEFVSIDEFTWLARKFNSRSSVKKVRVLEADGSEGKYTLLQWLRVQGLEAPPKARKLGVGGSNTNNGKEQKAKKKRKRKKVRFTQPEERESFDVIPLIDRIKKCSQEEHKKVTFGKSVIHGWGLFAKVAIKEGETVVEYRGDIVRHSVANEREISYREQKKDLYLFTANDHQVIDGTDCGSIGRFMNHSCAPSTYIKFAEDAETGLPHLVFLARCDILPGQELTFDYRLKEEGEDHKILCMCGAPTCKGTMN